MNAPSRLSRFMDQPDGIDSEQALAAADQNLQAHRDTALELIDRALGELAASEGAPSAGQAIARLADSVASLAGMFGLTALGRASKNLCDTVRILTERQTWDTAIVTVHVAAMRVLRVQTDEAEAATVLKGLDQLAARAASRTVESTLGSGVSG